MWARLRGAADEPEGLSLENGGYRTLDPVPLPAPGQLGSSSSIETVDRYTLACRQVQVAPHPAVLAFLRLHLAELRPEGDIRGTAAPYFSDADMYAFCDFLLRQHAAGRKAIFEHWKSVDASSSACAITLAGAQMLFRVLQLPGCHVCAVDLGSQKIGPKGAEALVETIRVNPRLRTIRLNGSFIHDQGARCFAELLAEANAGASNGNLSAPERVALDELDLSVNMISFHLCEELRLAAPSDLRLVLKGNRVLDEVLNASSHAVGVVLCIIGAVILGVELSKFGQAPRLPGPGGAPLSNDAYVSSNVIYLVSLFLLYLFSTLYHSLFALGEGVHSLFALFDHSAIYLLIAGSYTPFLTILFPDRPAYSVGLLAFLWVSAVCGIGLNLCYHGAYKVGMQVSSYIGMGWAIMFVFGDIWQRMSPRPMSLVLLVGGGVAYTAGVPWFVRDRRTCGVPDHTIWHVFVLAGSTMHYLCVLWYIVPFPYADEPSPW